MMILQKFVILKALVCLHYIMMSLSLTFSFVPQRPKKSEVQHIHSESQRLVRGELTLQIIHTLPKVQSSTPHIVQLLPIVLPQSHR